MTRYLGVITTGALAGHARRVYVDRAGQVLPLTPRWRHGAGFGWGYRGSGPSDLARSLLWDYLGHEPSTACYQAFKEDVVAGWPKDQGWELDWVDVDRWMAGWLRRPATDQAATGRDATAAPVYRTWVSRHAEVAADHVRVGALYLGWGRLPADGLDYPFADGAVVVLTYADDGVGRPGAYGGVRLRLPGGRWAVTVAVHGRAAPAPARLRWRRLRRVLGDWIAGTPRPVGGAAAAPDDDDQADAAIERVLRGRLP